ncbi:MAG TPA: DUF2163 domain-containing protein [Hyphomicrobiales bacterium]|jgi:uncharacterized phage protein (TIGR02218 family)
MKTLPPGLQAHLSSGATTLAWCWRVMRADGAVYGFTDHDRDIAFDATSFEAASGFTGTDIRQSLGLSVDNLDVSGALQSDRLSEADLAAGLFDDARIEIWRVNWVEPEQRGLMMSGSIGEVRRGETAFTAELRSLAHRLGQARGRSYQYACDATLGDARCGVDLGDPAYSGTGAVTAASAAYLFTASGLDAFADGWFAGGLLSWTAGANAGRAMEVKRFARTGALAEIELWRSMASGIAPGDAFTVTAGCDKTFPACKAKFANGVNFRGFPHIPGNKYLLAYPGPGDPGNDGASMNG